MTFSFFPTSPSSSSSAFPFSSRSALCVTVLSAILIATINHAYIHSQPTYAPGSLPPDARGGGAGSCKMSYMSPSYLHLSGYGRTQTRLGNGPWGLYLYREAGWDTDPFLDEGKTDRLALAGVPVLFIPGNAGSFKQVRSLAAAASRTYYEVPGVPREEVAGRKGAAPLDFFTLDFNDDFSAFHGQTLLDQAEYTADCIRYILSLYASRGGGYSGRPDPTAVIVVAHSMGGIVARAAMLDEEYLSGSISTIVTFASPHLVPPVPVDSGIDHVYSAINRFWRDGYSRSPSSVSHATNATSARSSTRDELSSVALISIAGGLSDLTIASESTSLSSLVPSSGSHGFTVFTTAIPGVQTPIDHLAILWCRQLMYTVAEGLLDIVDTRRSEGVVGREERVRKLKKRWVGGAEGGTEDEDEERVASVQLEQGAVSETLDAGERLVVRPGETTHQKRIFVLPVLSTSQTSPSNRTVFSVLTSARFGARPDDLVNVWACSALSASDSLGSAASNDVDPSCLPLSPSHLSLLPASPHSSTSPVLPAPVEEGGMSLVEIRADDPKLSGMKAILVVVKEGAKREWVVAEWAGRAGQTKVKERNALGLLLSPYRRTFPLLSPDASSETVPSPAHLVYDIYLPALASSLLTLRAEVSRGECQESTSLFAPLLLQTSSVVHETKYFPNVRTASLYTHSGGPFLPPASSLAGDGSVGTTLCLFLDPTCPADTGEVSVEISIDWKATLGSLFVRYRMAMVSVPFALVMFVVAGQMRQYNAGSPYPSFGHSLSYFLRHHLGYILLALLLLAYVQSFLVPFGSPVWLSNALHGTGGSFWAPLAPMITFAMVAVVSTEYLLVSGAVTLLAGAMRMAQRMRYGAWFTVTEPSPTLPIPRLLAVSFLLLTVYSFAPYQFAYLVLTVVHFFTTVRDLLLAWAPSPPSPSPSSTSAPSPVERWNRFHRSLSLLLILLTLLPLNALVLVVWVRNLAVGWLVPFRSDHNVLLLVGFLAVVEGALEGRVMRRTEKWFHPNLTTFFLLIPAMFSLVYGIRYTHRLYPLTNTAMLWLALGSGSWFSNSSSGSREHGDENEMEDREVREGLLAVGKGSSAERGLAKKQRGEGSA
ncbi:hypothetical protein JCM11641_004394 [Rhodosporidiobolus odoratus]